MFRNCLIELGDKQFTTEDYRNAVPVPEPYYGNPNIDSYRNYEPVESYIVNKKQYEYVQKNFENVLEIQQEESIDYGKVMKSPGELRSCVDYIEVFKNDENHIIGSQGQIMVNFGEQKCLLGTGLLIVLSNGDKKSQIERKSFVLTSSQIFKRIDSSRNQHLIAQSAVFSLGLNIDADGIFKLGCKTALNEYYDYPEYHMNLFTFNPFNDIALAACDSIGNDEIRLKTKNIPLAVVSIAKPGDRICIAGYPAEYNGKLYYMEGSIRGIYFNNSQDSAIITYNDINVSHGMNGSPVYLKLDDESWVVIGVHVAYDKNNNVNIATAFTKIKLDRLNAIANSYFHKPCQNLIYSPRVREIGRELTIKQIPKNILKNRNPKYRLRGCQGQIRTTFEAGLELLGSGLFLSLSIKNDGESIENALREKWFVLTCGHMFTYNDGISSWIDYPQKAVFSYGKRENENRRLEISVQSRLNEYYVFPAYLRNAYIDCYNSLAIAMCESNLKGDWEMEDIQFETVDKAKEGDPIRILHYSSKSGTTLTYVEGTITEIEYNDEAQDEAVIIYEDADYTPEQNGLPVFRRKNDGSWAVIGFQVKKERFSTVVAVGLTKSKLDWMAEIMTQYIE